VRVLRETIGEDSPLHLVTKQHVERACEVLRRVPLNCTQRYPRLPVQKAIEAAERAKDTRVLSERTLANYYILILAVFNYAVEDGLIPANPAKTRKLREMFRQKKKAEQRALFTTDELNAIFHSRLYTESTDTARNGKFFVPLLCLFMGLRCNEACQPLTADVSEEDGIAYLHVCGEVSGTEHADKRVKNLASWRKLPIHPELFLTGFMRYVEQRRRDKSSPLLFPDLTLSKSTGRYSHVFSKYFTGFLIRACGHRPKATLHSFRHHFRTALIAAAVQTEIAEALGGWKSQGSSEVEYRHGELPMLRDAIAKVQYPGLDLAHLYI